MVAAHCGAYGPRSVVWHGGLARGDSSSAHLSYADIDLLIVTDRPLPARVRGAAAEDLARSLPEADIDLVAATVSALAWRGPDRAVVDLAAMGVVLWGSAISEYMPFGVKDIPEVSFFRILNNRGAFLLLSGFFDDWVGGVSPEQDRVGMAKGMDKFYIDLGAALCGASGCYHPAADVRVVAIDEGRINPVLLRDLPPGIVRRIERATAHKLQPPDTGQRRLQAEFAVFRKDFVPAARLFASRCLSADLRNASPAEYLHAVLVQYPVAYYEPYIKAVFRTHFAEAADFFPTRATAYAANVHEALTFRSRCGASYRLWRSPIVPLTAVLPWVISAFEAPGRVDEGLLDLAGRVVGRQFGWETRSERGGAAGCARTLDVDATVRWNALRKRVSSLWRCYARRGTPRTLHLEVRR